MADEAGAKQASSWSQETQVPTALQELTGYVDLLSLIWVGVIGTKVSFSSKIL